MPISSMGSAFDQRPGLPHCSPPWRSGKPDAQPATESPWRSAHGAGIEVPYEYRAQVWTTRGR